MKKVLFTATVDSHILLFHLPYLKYFKEQGFEVHVATGGDEEIPYCDKKIKISFERSPLKLKNIKAIRQLKQILEEEKYDIIHTHTPMGSVITRLAAKETRKKNHTKVIYTAHGFHFYKGAPKMNWIVFYPIEKYLSKYTDTIITINEEDYQIAKKKFHASKTYLVNGVGISKEKFDIHVSEQEKETLRKELELKDTDYVILYVAELIKRKNQTMLIQTIKKLEEQLPDVKVLLVGNGALTEFYQEMIQKLKLQDKIKLLGFRKDVPKLMRIANMYVSTSRQEGLPVNIMEAMVSNIPMVVTNCRGNRDLIQDGKNGYLVEIDNTEELKEKILYVYQHYEDEQEKLKINHELIKDYLLDNIMQEMIKIYTEVTNEGEDNGI
ncbi:MAG: glycosyltransferase family 4 protein [Clostridia bacterium]|jgi:glycosyltransferase EpsD|nr:glycosyltransferase family 4 protein [Clostridia bacterium]